MKHLNKFNEANHDYGNGEITDSDIEYLTQCFVDFLDDPRTKCNRFYQNGYPSWMIKLYLPQRKTYGNDYHRDEKYIDLVQKDVEKELSFYEDMKIAIERGLTLKKDVRVAIDRELRDIGYVITVQFIPYLLKK